MVQSLKGFKCIFACGLLLGSTLLGACAADTGGDEPVGSVQSAVVGSISYLSSGQRNPSSIVVGPTDGHLYYTFGTGASLGIVDTAGTLHRNINFVMSPLSRLAFGSDGDVYVSPDTGTDTGGVLISRDGYDPVTGRIVSRGDFVNNRLVSELSPSGMVKAASGDLWYGVQFGIVHFAAAGGAHIALNLPVPVSQCGSSCAAHPNEIVESPDATHQIWFTAYTALPDPSLIEHDQPDSVLSSQYCRVIPGTSATVNCFQLPLGARAFGLAFGATSTIGINKQLWVTSRVTNQVFRITIDSRSGVPVGRMDVVSVVAPTFIAATPDGNMWVAHNSPGFARITPALGVDEVVDGQPGAAGGVAVAGNKIWFTKINSFSLGEVSPPF